VNIRGNLQTRLNKLQNGDCDALLLAFAGVHRMGYDDLIVEKIETSYFVLRWARVVLRLNATKS
jgi:hydroxymethylbilane synthase